MNIRAGDAQPPHGQDPECMTVLPCRIVLSGDVSDRFEPAFYGLSLHRQGGCTELRGTLADQSQLQSLLNRLFDLGMQLISINIGTGCARPITPPGQCADA